MKVIKNIDIYLTSKRPVRTIDVVQYDTGIQLVFTAKDFTIPTDSSATLYVQKPSGKFVYQEDNITIANNAITIDLENQALTEYGEISYQVSIENGTDTVTTFTGMMIVQRSLKDSGATKSQTVVRAFDELTVEKLAEFQERAETIASGVIATIPEDYCSMTAKVNESANAIKGKLSGAVVSADDVSPVEHLPVVKVVCPESVDPSTVKVTRCGKNMFDIGTTADYHTISEYTVVENGVIKGYVNSSNAGHCINLTNKYMNGKYAISFKYSDTMPRLLIRLYNNSGEIMTACSELTSIGFQYNDSYKAFFANTKAISVNIPNAVAYWCLGFVFPITSTANNGDIVQVSNIQVEAGGTATSYEPYNGTEHIPTIDGVVEGVTSLSPNMTIMTDTAGVIVECEYNKDTNKVISKLVNAISAMGGEVTI